MVLTLVVGDVVLDRDGVPDLLAVAQLPVAELSEQSELEWKRRKVNTRTVVSDLNANHETARKKGGLTYLVLPSHRPNHRPCLFLPLLRALPQRRPCVILVLIQDSIAHHNPQRVESHGVVVQFLRRHAEHAFVR